MPSKSGVGLKQPASSHCCRICQDVDGQRTELDTKLMLEVEWRESLQKEVQAEKQTNAEVRPVLATWHALS